MYFAPIVKSDPSGEMRAAPIFSRRDERSIERGCRDPAIKPIPSGSKGITSRHALGADLISDRIALHDHTKRLVFRPNFLVPTLQQAFAGFGRAVGGKIIVNQLD